MPRWKFWKRNKKQKVLGEYCQGSKGKEVAVLHIHILATKRETLEDKETVRELPVVKEPKKKKGKEELSDLSEEELFCEQQLIDMGADKVKRDWFSVMVKVIAIAWVIGLILFIFTWLTTGFQMIVPYQPLEPWV